MMARQRPSKCCGCGSSWDFYVVKKKVWLVAMPDHRGLLCLMCLQRRLGRPLNLNDFTKDAINNPIRFGFAMAINLVR